jgi:sorbitol-specific phosphotransferase system component IIBC
MIRRLLLIGFLVFLPTQMVFAQNFTSELDNTGRKVYGTADSSNFYEVLGQVLNVILSLLGVILLILVIYSGFLWMTAQGNSPQVEKAKGILVNAVIGIIILVSSFAISTFVVAQLAGVAGEEGAFNSSTTFVLQ